MKSKYLASLIVGACAFGFFAPVATAGDNYIYSTRADLGGMWIPSYWIFGPKHSLYHVGVRVSTGYADEGCVNALNLNGTWANSVTACTGSGTHTYRDYNRTVRYGAVVSNSGGGVWSSGYGRQYW